MPSSSAFAPASLVLAGFMGAGKTSVGGELARWLGWRFVDLDEVIAGEAGMSVPDIFRIEGEEGFRRRESEAIANLQAGAGPAVIATGGGAIVSEVNRAQLSALGPILHLDAPVSLLWQRAAGQGRPLATERATFYARHAERQGLYRSLPYQIPAGRGTPLDLARRIASRFVAPARAVRVQLPERSYDIVVAPGGLARLGGSMQETVGRPGRCVIVSHPAIWRRYGETALASLAGAGWKAQPVLVPAGEPTKSLARVQALYRTLIAAEMERQDPVIALGGGVVGDLAGFVAATYLRGVPFVQVPTTLLAQIDSSVGGKVGVNLPEGKNLAGAFHQPKLVVADPLTLLTLPRREFRGGLAELIKYGVIADLELFESIERDLGAIAERRAEVLVRLIGRACEIKARIVSADEQEAGLRRILNFGHTLGHAIETVAGYGAVRHGEAVAIGMVFAARLAAELSLCDRGLVDRLVRLLDLVGLPTRTDLPAALLLAAMQRDKKMTEGQIAWILPERLGSARAVREVPVRTVHAILQA